jgi:hypothetical protein
MRSIFTNQITKGRLGWWTIIGTIHDLMVSSPSILRPWFIPGGGGTQYKWPYGDVPQTWVAFSALWYINDPLFFYSGISMTPFSWSNLVYRWVVFSKFSQFFWKIGQFCLLGAKFARKFQKNPNIFGKFWGFGISMGQIFKENWYIHGSTSDFPAAHPYQNQSWVPPRALIYKMTRIFVRINTWIPVKIPNMDLYE